MSGIQFKALPTFPAILVGQTPIVVTKNGMTYTISFANAGVGILQVSQVMQQLAISDATGLVKGSITSDPYSILNIAWTAATAGINGTLYNFILSQLFGGNTANMATFWAAATNQPSSP